MSPPQLDNLLLSEIRDKVQAVFGYRPCLWQLKVVCAILKRDKDVASIAATGSGKTLTFWMPLLFIPDGIQIVVTPAQYPWQAESTAENFQAIADGKHRAIVTNIETLMKPGGGFEKLWNDKNFMAKVISDMFLLKHVGNAVNLGAGGPCRRLHGGMMPKAAVMAVMCGRVAMLFTFVKGQPLWRGWA
ncbi:hypothetical protein C8F04DRAFT_1393404 [Mycena alexandri]|uniref:DEAD/DEAH box helicase domain-containing protein n=1 Tax=Mycena alexandri TaxID=1745969 RepID=A0AAD6X3K4_9AGAR|nr:hypothetical protein C8F04DRAFT_1393404 [Mycena alexandri]